MKLLYIYDYFYIKGGIERIFADKMNWFAENGYDVIFAVRCNGKNPKSYSLSPKIRFVDLDVRFYNQYNYFLPVQLYLQHKYKKQFRDRLQVLIDELLPDIIVLPTNVNHFMQGVKTKAKIVFESHFSMFDTMNYISAEFSLKRKYKLNRMIRNVKKMNTALVCLTEGDAGMWQKYIPKDKIFVIPNFSNICTDNSIVDTRQNKQVIAIGRYVPQKGYDAMFEIWKKVCEKVSDWSLCVYGDGDRSKYESLLQDMNIGNVSLYGPVLDISTCIANSDFLIQCSRYEGFGLVLLEAMSLGKPCVAFDCSFGPSGIITHEHDGLLVEPGNINGFAESVCKLITDIDLRRKLGINAKAKSQNFTQRSVMPLWVDLFKSLSNKSC